MWECDSKLTETQDFFSIGKENLPEATLQNLPQKYLNDLEKGIQQDSLVTWLLQHEEGCGEQWGQCSVKKRQ